MAKSVMKGIWHFLWKSDSVWSWIIDLIIAFILVKFVFFPILALIFNSPLPLVVVESTSMLHEADFDNFWQEYGGFYEERNITKEMFSGWKFKNGFDKGDVMVIQGQKEYHLGGIIVFRIPNQSTPIIHRIIKENGEFSTKGDHNPYQLSYEKSISKDQIIGKAVGKIPKIGWIKMVFVDFFRMFS